MHQCLMRLFGNRVNSAYTTSNMNRHLATKLGLKSSPMVTNIGGRFRVTATNTQAFLCHEEAVRHCVDVGKSEQAEKLKTIIGNDSDQSIKKFCPVLIESSFPFLLFQLGVDELHAVFSGRRTYGEVKATIEKVGDRFQRALEKPQILNDLLDQLMRETTGDAQTALIGLRNALRRCTPAVLAVLPV